MLSKGDGDLQGDEIDNDTAETVQAVTLTPLKQL
jgi:hypothetical protein